MIVSEYTPKLDKRVVKHWNLRHFVAPCSGGWKTMSVVAAIRLIMFTLEIVLFFIQSGRATLGRNGSRLLAPLSLAGFSSEKESLGCLF